MKDAFDLWWQWAEKPLDGMLMIDADIHYPIMDLAPEDRRDRAKVNEAVHQAELNRTGRSSRWRLMSRNPV